MRDDLTPALRSIAAVDAWLDSEMSPEYRAQPLAHDWARVTKCCEEAGEVWKAFSRATGENPRKGVTGSVDEVLEELGDTACAALAAIQHLTKDQEVTWAVFSRSLAKARKRADECMSEVPRD